MLFCEASAFVLGNDINTDYLISSRRKRSTIDPEQLKQYILEDIRPGFYDLLDNKAAILVAGCNMGCGSAMEIAAQILPENKINVVLATSFARSFYRNCINNGVLPLQMLTSGIEEGDLLQIYLEDASIMVCNLSQNTRVTCPPLQGEVRSILAAGGLVPYVQMKRNGSMV